MKLKKIVKDILADCSDELELIDEVNDLEELRETEDSSSEETVSEDTTEIYQAETILNIYY